MNFIGVALTLIPTGVLLLVGIGHLWSLDDLTDIMRSHRVIHQRFVGPAAMVLVLAQLVVGTAGMAVVGFGIVRLALPVLTLTVVIYAAFAIYSWLVVQGGRGVLCGCSRTRHPMTIHITSRAVILASAAGVALGSVLSGAEPCGCAIGGPPQLTTVAMSVVGLGLAIWHLPAALSMWSQRGIE